MILAIDPGNVESAYVLVEDDLSRVVEKGKVENFELVDIILRIRDEHNSLEHIAIEMIASYGMAVGKTVFETCVWIGRFAQLIRVEFGVEPEFIYRSEEKMCLCHSMKAKDSNIRQALVDIYAPNTPNGGKGTKKSPGYFYGFKSDIYSALAVAHTYKKKYLDGEEF
jgi:hypothetical protein